MKHCPNETCPYWVAHRRRAEFRDEVETCKACDGPLAAGASDFGDSRPPSSIASTLASVACLLVLPVLSPWLGGVSLTIVCVVALMVWSTVLMVQRLSGLAPQLDAWLTTRFPIRPLVAVLVGGAGWGALQSVASHQSLQLHVSADPWLRVTVAAVALAALSRAMMRPARLRHPSDGGSVAVSLGVAWPLAGSWILACATASSWLVQSLLEPAVAALPGLAVVIVGAISAYRPTTLRAELASFEPSEAEIRQLVRRARLQSAVTLSALWLAVAAFADQPAEAGLLAVAALWLCAALADLWRGAAGPGEFSPSRPTSALVVAARLDANVAQAAIGTIVGNFPVTGSVTPPSR